ncbi:uncharacterized protein LOC119167171 isoform X3 [Rhipicephalus microplus]|uniref:uncharacterized protein LOC119167171 isoform X3 n=1 Tax=Rhipicephalus microplus TaxID=6941 RepID=UPI003F6C7DBF
MQRKLLNGNERVLRQSNNTLQEQEREDAVFVTVFWSHAQALHLLLAMTNGWKLQDVKALRPSKDISRKVHKKVQYEASQQQTGYT